jgi:hypothetical protein
VAVEKDSLNDGSSFSGERKSVEAAAQVMSRDIAKSRGRETIIDRDKFIIAFGEASQTSSQWRAWVTFMRQLPRYDLWKTTGYDIWILEGHDHEMGWMKTSTAGGGDLELATAILTALGLERYFHGSDLQILRWEASRGMAPPTKKAIEEVQHRRETEAGFGMSVDLFSPFLGGTIGT